MAVIFDQAQGQYTLPNGTKIPRFGPQQPWEKELENQLYKDLESYHNKSENNGGGGGGLRDDNGNTLKPSTTEMNLLNEQNKAESEQQKLWEREDAIREHIEQREDSALQRWVADARRAGINPNLALGATGAASGGGITNASQKDYTLENTLLQGEINQALADLERAFQKDENAKDRLNRIFTTFGLGSIMRIGK